MTDDASARADKVPLEAASSPRAMLHHTKDSLEVDHPRGQRSHRFGQLFPFGASAKLPVRRWRLAVRFCAPFARKKPIAIRTGNPI
jgi:hypothetical protein